MVSLCRRDTEITAELIVIQTRLGIVTRSQFRVVDPPFRGIIGNNIGCARLVRPVPICVLSKQVIVLIFIGNNGNLSFSRWTAGFKRARGGTWNIAHHSGEQVGAALPFHFGPSGIATCPSRLGKGKGAGFLGTILLTGEMEII
jgi:hypothetical protein